MLHIFFLLLSYQPVASAVAATTAAFGSIIQSYGYIAVFVLMLLEGIGLPVPSEVVLPLVGYYAAIGVFNPVFAFLTAYLATTCGLVIDYFIGYYVEKRVVYRHLNFFHIGKRRLEHFDNWFNRNGTFAVFIVRFIPEIRALISLPAGFAKMPIKRFLAASMLGTFIWDAVLIWFGYKLQSVGNVDTTFAAVGVFGLLLYVIYRYGLEWMDSGKKNKSMQAQRHRAMR